MYARLHVYSDMDEPKMIQYWSHELGIPRSKFRKSYVKKTKLADVTYQKGGHGHGTCNVSFGNREINDYVLEGIRYLRDSIK